MKTELWELSLKVGASKFYGNQQDWKPLGIVIFQKSKTFKGYLNLFLKNLNGNLKGSFKMVVITKIGGSHPKKKWERPKTHIHLN